jgi:uncharacterized protein (DUF433 family)
MADQTIPRDVRPDLLTRITVDPEQMQGLPCIRNLRLPVSTILRHLAAGISTAQLIAEFPDLQVEDISACLLFGAALSLDREVALPHTA